MCGLCFKTKTMDIVVGSMVMVTGILALIPASASVATYRATAMGPRRYKKHEDAARFAVLHSLYALQATIVALACLLIVGGILVFTARDIATL
jgi:hypothetical protein